jgi:cytochrome P450
MTQMPQSQARQLPLSMICELLGLPRADRPKFNSSGTELDARHGRRRLPECGPESLRECDAIGQFDAVRERGHEAWSLNSCASKRRDESSAAARC